MARRGRRLTTIQAPYKDEPLCPRHFEPLLWPSLRSASIACWCRSVLLWFFASRHPLLPSWQRRAHRRRLRLRPRRRGSTGCRWCVDGLDPADGRVPGSMPVRVRPTTAHGVSATFRW